jgi:hypothetical protein
MDRAYTVSEIDALRDAVENKWLWGSYSGPSRDADFSRAYKPEEKQKAVEEMVRTHMIAGHSAEDLLASERS